MWLILELALKCRKRGETETTVATENAK